MKHTPSPFPAPRKDSARVQKKQRWPYVVFVIVIVLGALVYGALVRGAYRANNGFKEPVAQMVGPAHEVIRNVREGELDDPVLLRRAIVELEIATRAVAKADRGIDYWLPAARLNVFALRRAYINLQIAIDELRSAHMKALKEKMRPVEEENSSLMEDIYSDLPRTFFRPDRMSEYDAVRNELDKISYKVRSIVGNDTVELRKHMAEKVSDNAKLKELKKRSSALVEK